MGRRCPGLLWLLQIPQFREKIVIFFLFCNTLPSVISIYSAPSHSDASRKVWKCPKINPAGKMGKVTRNMSLDGVSQEYDSLNSSTSEGEMTLRWPWKSKNSSKVEKQVKHWIWDERIPIDWKVLWETSSRQPQKGPNSKVSSQERSRCVTGPRLLERGLGRALPSAVTSRSSLAHRAGNAGPWLQPRTLPRTDTNCACSRGWGRAGTALLGIQWGTWRCQGGTCSVSVTSHKSWFCC